VTTLWLAFLAIVAGLLAFDLFVVNRAARELKLREAAWLGVGWIALAAAFALSVAWKLGAARAVEFTTGYLLELSLSFDNLFVFLVLFRFFRVARNDQRRVLTWGILGALVLRAVFIGAGVELVRRFEWVTELLGLFLVFSGLALFWRREEKVDPEKKLVLRLARRVLPVSTAPPEGRFFVVENGRRAATTLFLCLVTVEASDVAFAVDSIPAVFGVTKDPFVVYTSNVFAVLGLRSFFVLLARLMASFRFLGVGLAVVLVFVGAKMAAERTLAEQFQLVVQPLVSLAVVVSILAVAVAASVLLPARAAAVSDPLPDE
jgi:tellurite resistance protein TerC